MARKKTIMRVRHFLTAVLLSVAVQSVSSQQAPADAQPDWASMPTVAPTGKPDDPMRDYYRGTTIGEYHPLWLYHIWFNPDGTHILFYAHRYPDGTTHMGASQRYWRVVGAPGRYGLCLRMEPNPTAKESCGPFEFKHYGDVWYQDYDRSASGDIPTYNNVHEVFTFVAGKR